MTLKDLASDSVFDLQLLRYQFPEIDNGEWDSNWLMVSGHVRTEDRSWHFIDPCLTIVEAHHLANWLADNAADKPTVHRIYFTEPNLSLYRAALNEYIRRYDERRQARRSSGQ